MHARPPRSPAAFLSRSGNSDGGAHGVIDEDFRNDEGIYTSLEHCGRCNVSCDAVFPTAASTTCTPDATINNAQCSIATCAPGFELNGSGACVPVATVTCLSCNDDADCRARHPDALCISLVGNPNDTRCALPCTDGQSCADESLDCHTLDDTRRVCLPSTGDCSCTEDTEGQRFGCTLSNDQGDFCAGEQLCSTTGLSVCTAVFAEQCNGVDDDCDNAVDEDFRDANGVYIDVNHCGGCQMPCNPGGMNTETRCELSNSQPTCITRCQPNSLDLDGLPFNGCECSCTEGFVDSDQDPSNGCEEQPNGITGPPNAIIGDANCDGVSEDQRADFIFVTNAGNDNGAGTLNDPLRTLPKAIDEAQLAGKAILVARGIYQGPVDLVAGVSLFGGYRPDFGERNMQLFPSLIEAPDNSGLPVIRCQDITTATQLDGFTLVGSDSSIAGGSSTTLFSRGCNSAVILSQLSIQAGRANEGQRGDDASERLDDWNVSSLAELNGRDGESGRAGGANNGCLTLDGGAAGQQSCRGDVVDGGRGGDAACPDLGCNLNDPCANAGCDDFTSGGVCDTATINAFAVANPSAEAGQGAAGFGAAGELTYNAPASIRACGSGVPACNCCADDQALRRRGDNGDAGRPGDDGNGGNGCAANESLDTNTGLLVQGAGSNGGDGSNGSGGGGGSAGSGFAAITGTPSSCGDRSGGSGGGGGSGGCGAPGGLGGQGGGSSVGVIIQLGNGQDQGPTLRDSRIITQRAGNGGRGGAGATGGRGGNGGQGGSAAFFCSERGGDGAAGGNGGSGGGGGGGCGGHSYGIYIRQADQAIDAAYLNELNQELTIDLLGIAGRRGEGGFSPRNPGTPGLEGQVSAVVVRP